jgi:hypothetical protein
VHLYYPIDLTLCFQKYKSVVIFNITYKIVIYEMHFFIIFVRTILKVTYCNKRPTFSMFFWNNFIFYKIVLEG